MHLDITKGAAKMIASLRQKDIEENPQEFLEDFYKHLSHETWDPFWCFHSIEVFIKDNTLVEVMDYSDSEGNRWIITSSPHTWSRKPVKNV
jgi:hypothetical protein